MSVLLAKQTHVGPAGRRTPPAISATRSGRRTSRRLSSRGRGGASPRGEPVTDARLGQEIARPRRVGLELAPQVRHVDAQIVRLLGGVRPPDLAEQLAMGD